LVLLPMLAAAAPKVVTDIGPVQSIVARVMAGMGDPDVLLPPGASPHGHSLRPSDARRLAAADLVVWVGPALTPWLAGPIETLAPQATVLELEEAPGVTLLPIRADVAFEAHVHADGEEGHEHEHEHEQGDGEDHDHGHAHDGHLWLDPANAVAAARAVAAALGEIDPAGASGYAANAEAFAGETATLERRIAAELAPVRGRPYLVFHDAYQYFERSFDLPAAGSVALQEGVAPGAARVAALRERVRQGGVVCAFTEPQFEPRLLATILEDSDVRTGVLDPIGASLEPGPGLYPALLSDLAASLATCLGAGS
ncbi:MAG TPA: zinc ABC transporter substrate-binding protein, partial [Amaricoccus sp.]|nr:zinc ABC transporter substrate-binding protein [Amaricoccus sp.]